MTPAKRKISSLSQKPFLRWAGGKNWFVKQLPYLINDHQFTGYYEPFLGGGSVFFALKPKNAVLADLNADLIAAYSGIRDDVEGVISRIKAWDNTEEQYYAVRAMNPRSVTGQAARLIYLNHTSFNGIWRVNRKGSYNVPYGHNEKYEFDFERIRSCAMALQGAKILVASFEETLSNVRPGALVFLDPPYTVSHNENGFIEYNKTLFSLENQKALRKCIDQLDNAGAYYIMTNAAHQAIREIFEGAGEMFTISRNCTLGGKNARRGSTEEYVFTNIPGANVRGDYERTH